MSEMPYKPRRIITLRCSMEEHAAIKAWVKEQQLESINKAALAAVLEKVRRIVAILDEPEAGK